MSGYNFTGEIGWDHSRAELIKFLDEVDRELEKKAESNRQKTKKTEAVDNGE